MFINPAFFRKRGTSLISRIWGRNGILCYFLFFFSYKFWIDDDNIETIETSFKELIELFELMKNSVQCSLKDGELFDSLESIDYRCEDMNKKLAR